MADLGHGEKPFVVVSNNRRNTALDSVLAARITTSSKPSLASIVPLGHGEPVVGSVLGDDIVEIFHDEVRRHRGALSSAVMKQVDDALRAALAL